MNKHLVFIYGTLRRGSASAMSVSFPAARFISRATVNGSLYDLGAFPGLLVNESGSSVMGELYEVDYQTLIKLDEFEATSNYLRRQVEVLLENQPGACWVYEPSLEFYFPQTLISSGDWIEYAKSK